MDAPVETAAADAVLIFDGVFLLRRELIDLWDFGVFVAATFEETVRRAARRDLALFGDGDKVRHRYEVRYVPGQRLYFASARPREKANVVVDNDDPDRPALQVRALA